MSDAITPAPMWTLDDALDLARQLEDHVAPAGYHVALAGGVLLRGWSEHDLDLVFYPHHGKKLAPLKLERALRAAGLWRRLTVGRVRAYWKRRGITDTKHVEIWLDSEGRRVDVIMPADA